MFNSHIPNNAHISMPFTYLTHTSNRGTNSYNSDFFNYFLLHSEILFEASIKNITLHGTRARRSCNFKRGLLQQIQKFHLSGGKNRQHCEQNRQFINEMVERKTGERWSRLGSGLGGGGVYVCVCVRVYVCVCVCLLAHVCVHACIRLYMHVVWTVCVYV